MTTTLKLLLITGFSLVSGFASSHGSFEQPLSRVYGCYLEGPENPMSDACIDAVVIGGTQPLYDWNEVNQGEANDNHQSIIPNGTLCAGGRDKYRGLNQARTDWIEEQLVVNQNNEIEFVYYATAPHDTAYFTFYVTNDDYQQTNPLRWEDLGIPFCHITQVTLDPDGRYRMNCPLPAGKSGKHIIYNIWQRSDSPEAFYACMDVDFGPVSDIIFTHGFETSKE